MRVSLNSQCSLRYLSAAIKLAIDSSGGAFLRQNLLYSETWAVRVHDDLLTAYKAPKMIFLQVYWVKPDLSAF